MARLRRLALAGELHHALLRGLVGHPIFVDDTDRSAFVSALRDVALRESVSVHAYALLGSEIHLLLTPRDAQALGRMAQGLGRRYVAAFNRRHGRRGTLWEGRFGSSIIDGDILANAATVYIESLPVLQCLTDAAADWPWSSAGHHLGQRRDPLVSDHSAYWGLGNTPFERERAHATLLEVGTSPDTAARLVTAVRRGLALGSEEFIARISELAGRPAHPRPRGRPRKERE